MDPFLQIIYNNYSIEEVEDLDMIQEKFCFFEERFAGDPGLNQEVYDWEKEADAGEDWDVI